MSSKIIAFAFFGLICLIILAADTHQSEWLFVRVQQIPFGDKIAHFILFGILTLLVNRAIGFRHLGLGSFWQIGSLTVLSFALIEEVSQYFIPNRTLDIVDAACDVMGIGVFTAVTVWMMPSRKPPQDTDLSD